VTSVALINTENSNYIYATLVPMNG